MLTPMQEDLLVPAEEEGLTFAEAWERETRRERLVRLIAEIAAPPGAAADAECQERKEAA